MRHTVLLPLLLVACAGAPEENDPTELQAYFEHEDHITPHLGALNQEFSRNAVRASGYAHAGASLPERESWAAVARLGEGGLEPADVTPWLEAGDLDEHGEFAPCVRTRCGDTSPAAKERVHAAALRLVGPDHAVVWSDAHERALVIRSDRIIELNPKLVALVDPIAQPLGEPSRQAAPSSGSAPPKEAPKGVLFEPDRFKNHEPPPEVAPPEDSSDCDCEDPFDCGTKKSAGGDQGRSAPGLAFAFIAGLWVVRRSGRRGSSAFLDWLKLLVIFLLPTAGLLLPAPALAQDAAASPPPLAAHVAVQGFAPDALIAIDGRVVGHGSFAGPIEPGSHLVQVYRPGGPSYDFPIIAQAGVTTQVPPPGGPPMAMPLPAPAPEPPPPVKHTPRWEDGPYVLAQLGFVVPTARPEGFRYALALDEETGRERERTGVGYMVGANGGYRIVRWFGIGGLLMYGRAGGEGSVRQIERTMAGGRLEHEGPADFTVQSLRFGPHVRLMAGGNRARFLGGMSVGAVQTWIDLEHRDVFEQNGVLLERGTFHHDYSGLGQFVGWDLGAEFNPGDHLLLGVAFDLFVDGTGNVSGDPFDGTALGYFGMSVRLGYHAWALR